MRTQSKLNIVNPLGYYCPPNGAGPDYILETDLRRFFAFGLLQSWRWLEHAPGFKPEDSYWMREDFLRLMSVLIDAAADPTWSGEIDDHNSQGQTGEGDASIYYHWQLFRRAKDCYIIDLQAWGDALVGYDPLSVFMARRLLANKHRRNKAIRLLAESRALNLRLRRQGYYNQPTPV